jgi:hypothetical protein
VLQYPDVTVLRTRQESQLGKLSFYH